jgi:capping protein alpha
MSDVEDHTYESALSKEDILRIVRHFLLSSPPGEFEDVLSDVRELVKDDDLLNKGALDIFHTYNIEQLIPVDVPGTNHKVILCKYGEIDENHYLDPRTNKILTVNHAKGIATEVTDSDKIEDEDVKKKRESIQKAIDDYVADHYFSGISTVFSSQESKDEIVICITASKFNEKNYWSGRWRSVYRVSFEDKKVKLSGTMKVNVHYYEGGNVQLNTSKEHGETISCGDDAAVDIAKAIRKTEGNFQREIDSACMNLSETFKSLRRPLPLTKTLFNFASAQHKLVEDLTGKRE